MTAVTSKNAETLMAIADKIGTSFQALLTRANARDSDEARVSACLCLTIAELYGATLVVFHSSFQSHALILIRSMQEALVDLNNLLADPAYLKQIRFKNAKQVLNVIKEFEDDPDLQKDADAMKTMAGWRTKEQPIYANLKASGLKSMNTIEAFKKAGMTMDYGGYRFLCSFTHSNLTNLLRRHVRDGNLTLADPLPFETLKSFLGMAISIYGRALRDLPKYTDIPAADVMVAVDAAEQSWAPG